MELFRLDFIVRKEFFREVKTHAKSQCKNYRSIIQRDFEGYVKSCVKAVGSRQNSAEGHFRNAGLYVDQPSE